MSEDIASQDVSSDTKLRPCKLISLPQFIPLAVCEVKRGFNTCSCLVCFNPSIKIEDLLEHADVICCYEEGLYVC